jgi:competence protein ComEA
MSTSLSYFIESALVAWHRSVRSSRLYVPRICKRALGCMALSLGLVAASAQAMDVNTATASQLQTLRGLGPRTAELIVQERERGGKFESMEDFTERVRGIGAKKAQALVASGLQIGKAPPAAEGSK